MMVDKKDTIVGLHARQSQRQRLSFGILQTTVNNRPRPQVSYENYQKNIMIPSRYKRKAIGEFAPKDNTGIYN